MDTKTPPPTENSIENSTKTPKEKKPRKKRESKKKPPTFTISHEPVVVSFKWSADFSTNNNLEMKYKNASFQY